jgi:hypothetical protein
MEITPSLIRKNTDGNKILFLTGSGWYKTNPEIKNVDGNHGLHEERERNS